MDSAGRNQADRERLARGSGSYLHAARPAPPRPPAGPIRRVSSSSLLLRRPPGPAVDTVRQHQPFGLTNLRRNVCQHFYMTGPRGAIPIQAPHLLKGLMRQESIVSRCQLRGGVHLEQGYVTDICLSARFNQCVFYEDELRVR
jgi:hypothetical protein